MKEVHLLSHDEIVAGSKPYQRQPAIYFLLLRGKVVYVGRSSNVCKRVGQHIAQWSKPFDAYYAHYCDERDLNRVEWGYIEKFQPAYNNAGNKRYTADQHVAAIRASAGLTASTTASS